MPLPRCFFDISINGIPTGRIVFELFSDECPKSCENFRSLCTGERGEGKTTCKPLHYKGNPIHRVVKGFIIQGGDFENGDGSGGESIYGGLFKDENFKLKHDKAFLLSMANKGPNTNGSQFFITTRPAPHLDCVHVVFGRVVSGSVFVTEIENQKVDTKNRPYADVRITNCGQLVLMKKGKAVKTKQTEEVSSSDESSSSEEDSDSGKSESSEERKRKRRKKHKEQRKKKRSKQKTKEKISRKKNRRKKKQSSESDESSNSSDGEEEKEEEEEKAVTSTVKDELPPEITSTNKSWLYRHSKSPSPKSEEKKKSQLSSQRVPVSRDVKVSQSGRTLKGRGFMRYRTPPPTDRGSREHSNRERFGSRRRSRSPYLDRYRHRSPPYRNRNNKPRSRSRSTSPSRERHRRSRRESERNVSRSPTRKTSPSSNERKRHRSQTSKSQSPIRRGREDKDYSHRRHGDKDKTDKSSIPGREEDISRRKSSGSENISVNVTHQETGEGRSKWERQYEKPDNSSDEDHELEKAYQIVEQTLAEQQFGINALLNE